MRSGASQAGSGPTISAAAGSSDHERRSSAYSSERPSHWAAWSKKTSLVRAVGAKRRLRLLGDLAEGARILDRDAGEHLAVELDPGLAAAGDELVVREPLGARGCVDAHDPEPPHVALAALAVAIGVDERVLDRLVGDLVPRMPRADVALR